MSARKQVTKKLDRSYQRASKQAKSTVLDELVELTGWHRDYARTTLRGALKTPKPHIKQAGRKPTYRADLQPTLILCWLTLRGTPSKLLATSMP